MNSLKEKQASFQNLLIIALADGFLEQEERTVMLEQAEKMGLLPVDVESLFEDADNLQFFIPESIEDREKELKKLILMMLANGKISASEYGRCLEFARKAKIPKEQLDDWIDLFLNKENEYHVILEKNLKEYQKVFDSLPTQPYQTRELALLITKFASHESEIPLEQEKLVRFLWILFIRAPQLDKRFLNQIPMYCKLIEEGRYEWKHLCSALILNERTNCNSPVHPWTADLQSLVKDLETFLSGEI